MHKTEKSKITISAESRDANSNPWDHNLEFGQANPGNTFSEKIPEVWKNQTFNGMIFTIEKCRDLK
jgi:hypothetical protein